MYFDIGTLGLSHGVSYEYNQSTARLWKVTGDGQPGVSYDWPTNSDRVSAIQVQGNRPLKSEYKERLPGAPGQAEQVTNKRTDTNSVYSSYTYQHDALNRRKGVTYDGTAFGSQSFNRWRYNDRSELTSSRRYAGSYADEPTTTETHDQRRLYDYDPIGNRKSRTVGVAQGTDNVSYYCTNSVNQYTTTAATDTCPPTQATETFQYADDSTPPVDQDGNLIKDGMLYYTWDAENRLIEVAPRSTPVNGDKKVKFEYDYLGRRIHKQAWQLATGNWQLQTDEWYVYDGWNVALVLDADGNAIRKYTWGLDLSGQSGQADASGIQGAGGIAGLLSVEEIGETSSDLYWFNYDANGNVSELIQDGSTPTLAAHYEYDPYGDTLVAADVDNSNYVALNPFRFSTKPYDGETQSYSYLCRLYSPHLGRWGSRDPIGEKGGLNLAKFVDNNPVNETDILGTNLAPPRVKIFGEMSARISGAQSSSADGYEDPSSHAGVSWRVGSTTLWTPAGVIAMVKPCCKKVMFSQMAEKKSESSIEMLIIPITWRDDEPPHLDHGLYYPEATPWVIAKPFTPADLSDDPGGGGGHYKVLIQDFESVAVCVEGPDEGTAYGAVRWGHHITWQVNNPRFRGRGNGVSRYAQNGAWLVQADGRYVDRPQAILDWAFGLEPSEKWKELYRAEFIKSFK